MRISTSSFVVIGVVCSGCMSFAGDGGPRTVPPGKTEVGIFAETQFGTAKITEDTKITLPWIQLGVGGRFGLFENVEAAALVWGMDLPSLNSVGASLAAKWRWNEAETRMLDAAVSFTAAWQRMSLEGTPTYGASGTVRMPVGRSFGSNEIAISPMVTRVIVFGESQNSIYLWWTGFSVSYGWRSENGWNLSPEILFMSNKSIGFNGTSRENAHRGLQFSQVGLTLSKRIGTPVE